MKVKVVKIGNSKGIRIPKVLLRQTGIDEEVNLEVKENQIILEPIKHPVRSGWNSAFAKIAEIGDDKLLDEQSLVNQSSFDESDWEW
jgi:antitoxin MazE